MKRKRRWSIVGFARFSCVPVLLHILLTLGRVRVMDARDAKYLVVSTTVQFCGIWWRANGRKAYKVVHCCYSADDIDSDVDGDDRGELLLHDEEALLRRAHAQMRGQEAR